MKIIKAIIALSLAFSIISCEDVMVPVKIGQALKPSGTPSVNPLLSIENPTKSVVPTLAGVSNFKEITFVTLEKGDLSEIKKPINKIIRSEPEWTSFYKEYSSTKLALSAPPAAKVDFEKTIIAGVFEGETYGSNIEIFKIIETSKQIDIYYEVAGDNSQKSSITKSPFHIISFPNTEKPIIFHVNPQKTTSLIPNTSPSPSSLIPTIKELPVQDFMKGDFSLIKTQYTVVIQQEEEWQMLWKTHSNNSNLPMQKIDWQNNTLVGVFLGDRTGIGYKVQIDKLIEIDNEVIVYALEKQPAVLQNNNISYQPFAFALIPKLKKLPQFRIEKIITAEPPLPSVTPIANSPSPLLPPPIPLAVVTPVPTPSPVPSPAEETIAFETVENTDFSGVSTMTNVVIQKSEAFISLWQQHANNNNATVPNIDFEQKTIIGIFLGKQEGWYSLKIEKIAKTDSTLTIFVKKITNSDNVLTSSPAHIITINKTSNIIRFIINK